jgi:hypothetical protein
MIETLTGALVEVAANDTDRELSVARPSRSVSAVRDAATVPPGWEAFAECVEQRESGGNPRVLNHAGSGAAGLFQLMPPWRQGGPYNVRERLLQYGATKKQAKAVRVYLSDRPIHQWPALYQRIVFAEALDDGIWRHWYLAGSRCNGLVP